MILTKPLRGRIEKLGKMMLERERELAVPWVALRAAEESIEASKEMLSLGYRKEKYSESALIEEIGDLLLRVELLVETAELDKEAIRARIESKVTKYEKYKSLGRYLV